MTTHRQKVLAHLYGALTHISYSFNFIFLKIAVKEGVHPAFAVFCRTLGATLFFSLFFWAKRQEIRTIRMKHWILFLLAGLSGASLNKLAFIEGLQITSVIHASSIALLFPLFVILFEKIFFKTIRLKSYQYLGICIGLLGASLFVVFATTDQQASVWGDILVLINFVLFALYVIIVRHLTSYYSISVILLLVFMIGLFMMSCFTFPVWTSLNIEKITLLGWWNILGSVVFASILAQYFNIQSLKHLDASVTSVYTYIQPLGGSLLAIIIFAEQFTVVHFVAAIFIGTGLYLTSFKDVFSRKKTK